MYSAIYRKSSVTMEEEWQKHNGDRELISNIGKKGWYTCPFCGSKLKARLGEKKDRHFAHWSGTSCEEAKEQEKQINKYKRQKDRETPTHGVVCSFIHAELKGQESIHEGVSVQEGVVSKSKERWTYYPDLILTVHNKEVAISILTNITPQKDTKLIKSIQKQNEYYKKKGLDVIWFVEDREQTLNMHEHVIHLWASEVDLTIETAEDQKWTRFLKTLRKEKQHSIFNVFNYEPINQMDTKVKSLYYVSAKENHVTFTVNRLILDGKSEPYSGFVLNQGYNMRMSTALSIKDSSLNLSDSNMEEQLRNDFQKQYDEKLVSYIEKLEKEKKRNEEEQQINEWLGCEQEEPLKQGQEFQSKTSFFKNKPQNISTTFKNKPTYDSITAQEANLLIEKIYKRKITATEAKNLYFYMKAHPSLRQKIIMRDFQYALSDFTDERRKWLVEIEYL